MVDRSWIPIDKNTSDILKADNLANLFEEYGWDPGTLNQNDPISKLLKAIGISHLDLIRATFVPSGDLETVDNVITEMLRKSRGNVNQLNHAIKYIDAVTNNENLSDHVEGLLEVTEDELNQAREIIQHVQEDNELFLQEFKKSRDRIHTISKNRSVGKQVEGIVEQILQKDLPSTEFNVDSVHEGADFEITVTQGGRKFWIEVKSTRIEGDSQGVKMSSSQAKKAVEEKENFLLCVVPIPESPETDIDTVEDNMLFIANIGEYLAHLYENIKQFEKAQAKIKNPTHISSDVELVVGEGKPSVLVKKSVWEKDGFRHTKLLKHLGLTNNDLAT